MAYVRNSCTGTYAIYRGGAQHWPALVSTFMTARQVVHCLMGICSACIWASLVTTWIQGSQEESHQSTQERACSTC
eukprot:scaffold215382_cov19-Tisochrysis_lutea.AAC.3